MTEEGQLFIEKMNNVLIHKWRMSFCAFECVNREVNVK